MKYLYMQKASYGNIERRSQLSKRSCDFTSIRKLVLNVPQKFFDMLYSVFHSFFKSDVTYFTGFLACHGACSLDIICLASLSFLPILILSHASQLESVNRIKDKAKSIN